MRRPSDTARQRANATRKAILKLLAKRGASMMPYEVAKTIHNLPGPVARAMRALASRGLLKEQSTGWVITATGREEAVKR